MAYRIVRIAICCALGIALLTTGSSRAERVELKKPVKVSAQKSDKTKLVGRLTAYDESGFDLIKGKDERLTVKWDELDAANLFAVRGALLAKGTAEQWIQLGRDLRAKGADGEKVAEKAFARALRIDPKAKEQVEAAKVEEIEKPKPKPKTAGSGDDPKMPKGAGTDGEKTGADGDKPGGGDGAGNLGGPKIIGDPLEGIEDGKPWPELSEEQMAAAVKELNAFGEQTKDKMGMQLSLHETKFFLFYSDLSAKEATEWASLLDRMYARLAALFGIEKGKNVWRGKAIVFVFSKPQDYRRFQSLMHQTNAGGSAGMCHCFRDGTVHIAFYRQPDRLLFAHVLVHESVHGFLHRFKTPTDIPSWANEGLAEVIARELVPRPASANQAINNAKEDLRLYQGLGGIFELDHISAWQYPVAETMCAFMIRQSKRGYVNFIIGIKEGLTWEESLEKKYKAGRSRLVAAYGESMGIKNLSE